MPQRILIVDDEREIRRLVSSYLIDDGFDVEELDNGKAAIERMQRHPAPDLVILDVRMPEFDGIETLRELRRRSDVHVIMLTAAAEETDRLIGLSVGAVSQSYPLLLAGLFVAGDALSMIYGIGATALGDTSG